MYFKLKRGQKCVIRFDIRETEAVKIAAANLARDLERTIGVLVQISHDAKEADMSEEFAEIIVGTLNVSGTAMAPLDVSKLQDAAGGLRKEAYLHSVSRGRLVIAGTDRRGSASIGMRSFLPRETSCMESCRRRKRKPFSNWY